MGFNWEDYLNLAQYLQGNTNVGYSDEAAKRAAVSRAYYAAFCYARNYAHDNLAYSLTRDGTEHAALRKHFAILGIAKPSYNEIAENLKDLRQWRNFCDYEDMIIDIDTLVESALTGAQEIIDILKSP